jgi:hypothetical protein
VSRIRRIYPRRTWIVLLGRQSDDRLELIPYTKFLADRLRSARTRPHLATGAINRSSLGPGNCLGSWSFNGKGNHKPCTPIYQESPYLEEEKDEEEEEELHHSGHISLIRQPICRIGWIWQVSCEKVGRMCMTEEEEEEEEIQGPRSISRNSNCEFSITEASSNRLLVTKRESKSVRKRQRILPNYDPSGFTRNSISKSRPLLLFLNFSFYAQCS